MKMLKKLALVSAISMISAGAFAMEAMDEETMSATTGQDGITILISPATKSANALTSLNSDISLATLQQIDQAAAGSTQMGSAATTDTALAFKGLSIKQIVVHDNDGLENNATYGGNADTVNSGALVIGDGTKQTVVFANDTTPIEVKLDMVGDSNGANTGGGAMLNIAITTPTLAIQTGDIYVADSYNTGGDGVDDSALTTADSALAVTDADNAGATDGNAHRGRVKIMSGIGIVMGGATTVIQLGNEAQGAMIRANTSIIGGLTINNFELIDANGLGSPADVGTIKVGSLVMKDVGGANLTVDARINVSGGVAKPASGEGLYITLAQFGDATNGADLSLNNVAIGKNTGTTPTIGDIQLLGLNIAGTTMIIRGH